jgi:DNA-binding NarL/FixJ family response regulator
MRPEIEVLIAEDHPIFRKGLRQIVESEPGLKVVGEAENGERALELIRTCRPQVAVLDVEMPRKDGLAVAGDVRSLRLEVALIILTMHKNERFFNAAMDAGVRGYVLKESITSEIVAAIKAVAAGHAYITPALSDCLLSRNRVSAPAGAGSRLSSLTQAEMRVLRLVAGYKTSKEIAEDLFLSVRTVDRHRANIGAKLELSGPHALLQFALEHKAAL